MHYSKIKGDIMRKCNICGEVKKMTWDHVPPKFCFNDGKVIFKSFEKIQETDIKYDMSQNGIRYRTLCENCNNNLLGSKYDIEYKKLVDLLYDLYITKGEIAQFIKIEGIKVNKVSRSIVGHILAAKEEFTENDVEKQLRKYFLDETEKPPQNLNLLYYVYIYNTISIVRDFISKNMSSNPIYKIPDGMSSIINTFPLAFLLVSDSDDNCGLYDLFEKCTSNIEEEITLKLNLLSYMFDDQKTLRNPGWPCFVANNDEYASFTLFSEHGHKESVISNPRNLKYKASNLKTKYEMK